MTDDATLSDFAATDTDEDGATETSREGGDTADGDSDRSDPPVDSPTAVEGASPDADESEDGSGETAGDTGFSTYAWGTYTCSQCEGASTRVWRSDGELVCIDCKTW
ncbi:DUF7573 domain-containing protein [Natrinema salinisoli]|uniref:DUF7573 domain-containing protein n=1 Tax=Natrinema salinisoli TaxID=2878535 RepID=UPI001CF02C04|nr:hypothetical protein [Natrinema salinisoli]